MEANLSSRKEYDSNLTSNYSNRTSFLIEDILYRQKENQDEIGLSPKPERHLEPPTYKQHSVKFEEEKLYPSPKYLEKRQEKPSYSCFQPHLHSALNGCMQNLPPAENGYIQVMGALGAYLGTPYKTISEHPYFLAQGILFCPVAFF